METKILIIFLILILYIIYNLYHKKTIENFETENEKDETELSSDEILISDICSKILKTNAFNLCNFFTTDSFNNWAKNSGFDLSNLTEQKIINSDYYKNLQIIIDNNQIYTLFYLNDIFHSLRYFFGKLEKVYLDSNIIDNKKNSSLQSTREEQVYKSDILDKLLMPNSQPINQPKYQHKTLNIQNSTYEIGFAQYKSTINLGLENLNNYKEKLYPEYHRYFFFMDTLAQVMNKYTSGRNVVILNNYSYKFQNDNKNQEENFNYSNNNNQEDNFTNLRESMFVSKDMNNIYYPDTGDIKIFGDQGIILKNDTTIYKNDNVSIPYNYFKNLPNVEDIKITFSELYDKIGLLLEEIKKIKIVEKMYNRNNYPFLHLIYDLREENHILIYLDISDNLNVKNNKFIEFSFKWRLIFLNKQDNLYTINYDNLNLNLRKNIRQINERILPKEQYFERYLNDFYINDLRLLAKNFNFSTPNGGDSFIIEENIDRIASFWGGKPRSYGIKIGFSHTLFPFMQYYPLINLICINQIIIEKNKVEEYETLSIFKEFTIDLLKDDPYVEPNGKEKSYINLFIDLIENDINITKNKFEAIINKDMDLLEKLEFEDDGKKIYFYNFRDDRITQMKNNNPSLNKEINKEENITPPINIQPFTNYSEVIENFSNKCIDKKSNSNEIWKDVNLIDSPISWNCPAYKDNGWCENGDTVSNKYKDVINNDLGESAEEVCCVCGGGIITPAPSNTNIEEKPGGGIITPAPSNTNIEVETDFFISNLPSEELLNNTKNKLKEILGISKDIKSEVKDEQIIFTIPDMTIEDLNKNPDTKNKLIKEVRDIFMDRLKELGKTFNREQINVKFMSGSIKVIVEILSIEEVEAKKKQSYGNVVNRNYIQFKPMGKNGLFVPRTEIGDMTGELNKLFQDASNIGGMTLN